MSEDEKFKQVEDYLLGQMSTERKKAFQERLTQDPDLAAEVARYHLALDVEHSLWKKEMRPKITKWQAELQADKKKARRRLGWWGFLALILTSGLIYQVYQNSNEETPSSATTVVPIPLDSIGAKEIPPIAIDTTFSKDPLGTDVPVPQAALEPDESLPPAISTRAATILAAVYTAPNNFTRSREGTTAISSADPLYLADSLYRAKEFAAAIQQYEKIKSSTPAYLYAQVALGHAAMQEQRYVKASQAFAEQLRLSSGLDTMSAQWNVLLSYLGQLPEKEQAFSAEIEKILADPLHDYYRPALQLQGLLQE